MKKILKKEREYLKYIFVINAMKEQKFRKKNNSGLKKDVAEKADYGKEITIHEHHREEMMVRIQKAMDDNRLQTTSTWRSEKGGEPVDLLREPEKAIFDGKYRRADRWSGKASYFSWNAWMDSVYEVKNKSVSWSPVSYHTSKTKTLEEDIDGALVLYANKTGNQTGFITAGVSVNVDYLVKLSKRAAEKGFHLKLAESTRKRLEMQCPDKLEEIVNNLDPEGNGVHLHAEAQRKMTW